MAWQLTPETAQQYRKIRRRAGVRAFAITFAALLLIGLFCCTANTVLQKIAEFRWKKAISSAVQSGNTVQAAKLLNECSRQASYLKQKPFFISLEKEIFRLQQAERLQKQEFRKSLQALQNKLKTHSSADFPWQDELIKIAALASDHGELAEVRSLEAHCQALTQQRMIKSAQSALQEISAQEKAIGNLTLLKNQRRWLEHKKSCSAISRSLIDLQTRYPEIPEIGKRAMQLKKLLEQAAAAAFNAEKQLQNETASYRKIWSQTNAESLRKAIEKFRADYPQSSYNAELSVIYNDLELLKVPFAPTLKKILAKMAENSRNAQTVYAAELEKIIAEELQFGTFELIMQQFDGSIIRWETLSRSLFVKQPDGTSHIKFTAIDNRPVKGVFAADGSGVVEYAGELRRGRMIYGKSSGALPESFKQRTLLKIQQYLQKCKTEDFPVFLVFLQQEKSYGKLNLLPQTVKNKLRQAEARAEKTLNAPAAQYLFTRDIIRQCSENTPVFAGIVKLDGKTPEFVTPAALPENATVWIVDSRQKPGFFEVGKLRNNIVINSGKVLPFKRKYAVAAVPENGADYAARQVVWAKNARKNNLKLPPLPEFLAP